MRKKYFYSVLWMFLLVSPAGYAFDVQMHKVGASMPANGLGGPSAYHIATTSSSVTTSVGSYYTSSVSHYGKSASAKHSRQDYVPAVRTGYVPILYKVNAQETYQVAQFEVNAPNIPRPMRSAGLVDEDDEEDGGTVDEDNITDLDPFAPVGDIPWGVMLLLAGLLLYTKQRKNHPTHSTCPDVSGKFIAKMNTLSKPLSILLLCLLIAPAAKADYTLTRLWRNTTGQSLTPLSPLTAINNTTPGTCGAFIVDTAGMLYIDDNSTYPQQMIRLLPNGDPHPKGNIEGCEDGNKYLWCEYDPKANTAYWFIRNGLKNETEGFEDDMAWVKYRNITQHENPEGNDAIHHMANIYTSTAQVALSPDQYLWTASWDNAKSYCTIRRAKLTNSLDEHSILNYNQKITTNLFPSIDGVYIAPINSTRALVVNRSTNIYYCELSQQTQSLTQIILEENPGLTGCYSTLGGTVFKMGGKYYYTAGRSSDDNGSINYLGAFTVYKFNDAAPSNNITKTYYKNDIGLTPNDNTTTCTVTFRTVVKHDATYGDYALIYQFVPGHGVACYYYTETDGKDEHRTVNIRVTNGTATCNEAPVTQTKVRYFAKFQPNGETLTITWCDENGDATQTQTIVATPQQKAGYKAVFKGWNIPKEGYLTADCEITAEYTYQSEASAIGNYYFSRVWANSPAELRDLGTNHVLTSTDVPYGTSGSFFARHKGDGKDGLYVYATVSEDPQVKWRLLRFSEEDGHYIDSRDVLSTTNQAFRNYQWCEYYEAQDRLFWFHYRGYANTTLESYQMRFSDASPVSANSANSPKGNSAQARITPRESGIVWSVEAWDSNGNDKDPVVCRSQINIVGETCTYVAQTALSTTGVGAAGGQTTTTVIPIDHDNALILRKGKDLISSHFIGNPVSSTNQILHVTTKGVEGILDCLGGATFKHNGKCYYVTGCRAKNGTDYRGACAVLELAGATVPSSGYIQDAFTSATVVATYKGNIANKDTEQSQDNYSDDVTFYAVDKTDYVLIYAFSPKNGLACYYFSTKQDFDYSIRYVGNGATGGTMPDQLVRHGDKTALDQYAYTREFMVNYHYQNSRQADTQAQVSAAFKGWEDHSSITYWSNMDAIIVQTWNRSNFDAPYYSNRKKSSDVWEHREFGNRSFDKTGLLKHYLQYGKKEYEGGNTDRKPFADDPTVYGVYPNKDMVNNLMTEPLIANWAATPKVVELWAQWEDKSVTLPTPDARPCYIFAGWYDAAEGGNKVGNAGDELFVTKTQDLFARWELTADAGQADFLDRLVTWTPTTATFDLNGFYYMSDAKKVYPSNSDTRTWKINDIEVNQETANLDPVTGQKDKTFTITIPEGVSLAEEEYVYIKLYHNGTLVGGHAFPVPVIDNQPEAGRDLYVHGDLEITADQTAKNIYIEPTASLTITNGATLTVTDTLYIRSRGTQVGQLLNNGTLTLGAGKLLYTHQMAQKNVAEPLAMSFNCTLPKTAGGVACVPLKTRLQAETGKASGNHVVIKKYNGATRANGWDGTAAALWDKLSGADITLKATEGYEIVSGSAYYREYLFPLTYNKAATTEANLTAYKAANTAPHNIGWNFLCTPYTSNYSQSITLSPSDQKYAFIVRYAADGAFITSINMGGLDIPPFTPFYVQVNGTGENNQTVVLTYTDGAPAHLRASVQAEENPTSWASITLSDGNAADQTTLIICNDHQDGYEVGADCEKMLGTTEVRPQVYTVALDGLRAFNALPEATAATPVAVGYIAPKAAELTFSLSEDFPLEKIEHLYLSDYETGTVTDLISNHYTFFTTAGTFQERFALYATYRNEVSTEINSEANTADMPRKVMKDGQLYIIVQGRVLDTTGREVSVFE